MSLRLITLHHHPQLGGFDDSPRVDLKSDRETHFFSIAEVPHICLVVSWQEAPIPAAILAAAGAELFRHGSVQAGR